MDIFRYINSKDISEHLRKIGYQFSSLEAAWIIQHCSALTLSERHSAWHELIRTMPDCRIEKRFWTREWPSLHRYLEKYMDFKNRLYEAFLNKDDKAAYQCMVKLKNDSDEDYSGYLYSCFEKCQKFVDGTYNENDAEQKHGGEFKLCRMEKHYLDDVNRSVIAEFNNEWDLVSIWECGSVIEDICGEMDDFEGLWFSFPTPFKKGDIVVDVRGNEPFVLNEILPNDEEYIKRHEKDADESDMVATGYFQDDDGSIFYECMHNYMELELYRGDLTGKRRILKALSNFQKDEIGIDLYSKAYHAILMEEYARNAIPRYFTDEGMALVGFEGKCDKINRD